MESSCIDLSVAAIERYIRFQSQNYDVGSAAVRSDHTTPHEGAVVCGFGMFAEQTFSFKSRQEKFLQDNFKDVDNRYQKKPEPCFYCMHKKKKTSKRTSKASRHSCGKHKVFIGSDKLVEDLRRRFDITLNTFVLGFLRLLNMLATHIHQRRSSGSVYKEPEMPDKFVLSAL